MAARKEISTVTIHTLCLPRKVIARLWSALVETEQGPEIEGTLLLVFGKSPYPFNKPKHVEEAAPLREFGRLSLTAAQRQKVFNRLPRYLQTEIKAARLVVKGLGPFIDSQGRYYKCESIDDDTLPRWTEQIEWTVLLPKGSKTLVFPEIGDTVHLVRENVGDAIEQLQCRVEDIALAKKASAKIYTVFIKL